MSHASSSALMRCVFLFLRFYESSVLMRFQKFFFLLFLRFYEYASVVQQRGSNRIRIEFESDSNRNHFEFALSGGGGRFFYVGWDATRFCQPTKAVLDCFDYFFRRKRKMSWRGLELTRFRKRAAQSASPRLVPWAKMATVKTWECTTAHTPRRTQAPLHLKVI